MKAIARLLLVLLIPAAASAQAPPDGGTADTLDWRRYHPLAVGDVWEYEMWETFPLKRQEIVEDTLANGRRYVITRRTLYAERDWKPEPRDQHTIYVPYDSLGAVVTVARPDADTCPPAQSLSTTSARPSATASASEGTSSTTT